MDCIDHGVAESQTPLSNFHFQGRCPSRRPQELTSSRRRRSLHTGAGSSGRALNCRLPWPGRAVRRWYLTRKRRQEAGPPASRVRLPVVRSQGEEGLTSVFFFLPEYFSVYHVTFSHNAQGCSWLSQLVYLILRMPISPMSSSILDCFPFSYPFCPLVFFFCTCILCLLPEHVIRFIPPAFKGIIFL